LVSRYIADLLLLYSSLDIACSRLCADEKVRMGDGMMIRNCGARASAAPDLAGVVRRPAIRVSGCGSGVGRVLVGRCWGVGWGVAWQWHPSLRDCANSSPRSWKLSLAPHRPMCPEHTSPPPTAQPAQRLNTQRRGRLIDATCSPRAISAALSGSLKGKAWQLDQRWLGSK
jgi:hypothetical protein